MFRTLWVGGCFVQGVFWVSVMVGGLTLTQFSHSLFFNHNSIGTSSDNFIKQLVIIS